MEGYQWGGEGGRERMEEKVQRIRSKIGRYKIDRDVKKSIGNGEAKELICMTHGYELSAGWECWREGVAGQRGIKGRKNRTTVIA